MLHLQWWVAEIQAEGNKEILWSLVQMLTNVYHKPNPDGLNDE